MSKLTPCWRRTLADPRTVWSLKWAQWATSTCAMCQQRRVHLSRLILIFWRVQQRPTRTNNKFLSTEHSETLFLFIFHGVAIMEMLCDYIAKKKMSWHCLDHFVTVVGLEFSVCFFRRKSVPLNGHQWSHLSCSVSHWPNFRASITNKKASSEHFTCSVFHLPTIILN